MHYKNQALKSDQNGIESNALISENKYPYAVEIRPKWDWKTLFIKNCAETNDELKSDQKGIESVELKPAKYLFVQLKSDQKGIESRWIAVNYDKISLKLKSDQKGIESGGHADVVGVRRGLKSDQKGIERRSGDRMLCRCRRWNQTKKGLKEVRLRPRFFRPARVEIRPKRDWKGSVTNSPR